MPPFPNFLSCRPEAEGGNPEIDATEAAVTVSGSTVDGVLQRRRTQS